MARRTQLGGGGGGSSAAVDEHIADTTTHGATGDLVGTSDTQTLSNKTFSDDVNLAAGAKIIIGGDVNLYRPGADALRTDDNLQVGGYFNGTVVGLTQPAAEDTALFAAVQGDADARFYVRADGRAIWGAGDGVFDTNLYRVSADYLQTDDSLIVGGPSLILYGITTVQAPLDTSVVLRAIATSPADTQYRYYIDASGKHHWGSGAALTDTNLYRNAEDVLKTDDSFIVGGDLTVLGSMTGALPRRATATATTASLAAGAATSATSITMMPGYRLYSIGTSRPARVRLYTTTAARTADLARAVGVDPASDAGVVLDYVTADANVHTLSPLVDGANMESTPTATIAMTVTNLDVGAGTVVVTLVYLPTEAP